MCIRDRVNVRKVAVPRWEVGLPVEMDVVGGPAGSSSVPAIGGRAAFAAAVGRVTGGCRETTVRGGGGVPLCGDSGGDGVE